MSLRPATYLKLALRSARRRRYGYAALRALRRGLVRAMAEHRARSIGPAVYASELDAIRAGYGRALSELRRKFPALDLADERAAAPPVRPALEEPVRPAYAAPAVRLVGNLHTLLGSCC